MTIFIPVGDPDDGTRLPAFYDETYEFLVGCGIQALNG
jgi:hypothetical protein